MISNVVINQCVFHRNGITGLGFYAVAGRTSLDGIEERFVATVGASDFADFIGGEKVTNPSTRILFMGPTGGLDLHRTMRGDDFHQRLCSAIKEWKEKFE